MSIESAARIITRVVHFGHYGEYRIAREQYDDDLTQAEREEIDEHITSWATDGNGNTYAEVEDGEVLDRLRGDADSEE